MCRYLTREWLTELCEEVPTDPQRATFTASISEVLAAVLENEVSLPLSLRIIILSYYIYMTWRNDYKLGLLVYSVCTNFEIVRHLAVIAQLGERQTEDLKVPGSIPGHGTFSTFLTF